MMNTILNLGLNDVATEGLAKATKNERFAYDAYRRLINMFGDVVMGMDHHQFEKAFDKIKKKYKVKDDTEVPAEGLKELCEAYKQVYKKHTGEDFPQDPVEQLELAIKAVFGSWNTERSRQVPRDRRHPKSARYRRQRPVDGLRQHGRRQSGTGVAFTRNPQHRREQVLRRVPDQCTR